MKTVLSYLKKYKLEPKVLRIVYPKEGKEPNLVLIEAKKGGSAGLFLTKPLLLKNPDGSDTFDSQYIYKNGAFHEQYDKP